ncbi:hypothetical protein P9112_012957 [Eukaryota sp. TZLM1-RC]
MHRITQICTRVSFLIEVAILSSSALWLALLMEKSPQLKKSHLERDESHQHCPYQLPDPTSFPPDAVLDQSWLSLIKPISTKRVKRKIPYFTNFLSEDFVDDPNSFLHRFYTIYHLYSTNPPTHTSKESIPLPSILSSIVTLNPVFASHFILMVCSPLPLNSSLDLSSFPFSVLNDLFSQKTPNSRLNFLSQFSAIKTLIGLGISKSSDLDQNLSTPPSFISSLLYRLLEQCSFGHLWSSTVMFLEKSIDYDRFACDLFLIDFIKSFIDGKNSLELLSIIHLLPTKNIPVLKLSPNLINTNQLLNQNYLSKLISSLSVSCSTLSNGMKECRGWLNSLVIKNLFMQKAFEINCFDLIFEICSFEFLFGFSVNDCLSTNYSLENDLITIGILNLFSLCLINNFRDEFVEILSKTFTKVLNSEINSIVFANLSLVFSICSFYCNVPKLKSLFSEFSGAFLSQASKISSLLPLIFTCSSQRKENILHFEFVHNISFSDSIIKELNGFLSFKKSKQRPFVLINFTNIFFSWLGLNLSNSEINTILVPITAQNNLNLNLVLESVHLVVSNFGLVPMFSNIEFLGFVKNSSHHLKDQSSEQTLFVLSKFSKEDFFLNFLNFSPNFCEFLLDLIFKNLTNSNALKLLYFLVSNESLFNIILNVLEKQFNSLENSVTVYKALPAFASNSDFVVFVGENSNQKSIPFLCFMAHLFQSIRDSSNFDSIITKFLNFVDLAVLKPNFSADLALFLVKSIVLIKPEETFFKKLTSIISVVCKRQSLVVPKLLDFCKEHNFKYLNQFLISFAELIPQHGELVSFEI